MIFKRCPKCGVEWPTREAFLSDYSLETIGYQVSFEDLVEGIFLFQHSCGTSLGIAAGEFRSLYDGEVFQERATGTDKCPGFCLRIDELRACPAQCECAFVREILQSVLDWTKV
jgi:hypothetical protein